MRFVLSIIGLVWLLPTASTQWCVKLSADTIPALCSDFGYDTVWMPNLVGEYSDVAGPRADEFTLFIRIGCTSAVKDFICLMYFPPCQDAAQTAVGPCRELCQEARDDCEATMREVGFLWPESLSCELLPSRAEGHVCRDSALQRQNSSSASATSGPVVSGSATAGFLTARSKDSNSQPSGSREDSGGVTDTVWPGAGPVGPGGALHGLRVSAAALVQYLSRAQTLMDTEQKYLRLKQENLRLQNRKLRRELGIHSDSTEQ